MMPEAAANSSSGGPVDIVMPFSLADTDWPTHHGDADRTRPPGRSCGQSHLPVRQDDRRAGANEACRQCFRRTGLSVSSRDFFRRTFHIAVLGKARRSGRRAPWISLSRLTCELL